ncbi:peptidase inhibitor family I36 protein [Streptomyces cellulosae]|uniref:Peptidase inhibitor family I36 protein n=1 Tax=Streptomyces cellulosae TaxID=1968 RepID=A0ABW7YHN1_STRCE
MSASPRKIGTGLAGLALAGLSILAAPGIAGAAGAPAPTPGSQSAASAAPSAAAADGYFYAWEGANRTGKYCRWLGDDTNWTTCSPGGNMRNQASSIENRGWAPTRTSSSTGTPATVARTPASTTAGTTPTCHSGFS